MSIEHKRDLSPSLSLSSLSLSPLYFNDFIYYFNRFDRGAFQLKTCWKRRRRCTGSSRRGREGAASLMRSDRKSTERTAAETLIPPHRHHRRRHRLVPTWTYLVSMRIPRTKERTYHSSRDILCRIPMFSRSRFLMGERFVLKDGSFYLRSLKAVL